MLQNLQKNFKMKEKKNSGKRYFQRAESKAATQLKLGKNSMVLTIQLRNLLQLTISHMLNIPTMLERPVIL